MESNGSNKRCAVCNGKLKKVFSLGNLYVSNFIPVDHKSSDYPKSDLTILVCPLCGTARLRDTIKPDTLYKQYYYESGINETMRLALCDVVSSSLKCIKHNNWDISYDDIWLDIACNDLTLLKHIPLTFRRIGIDPSSVTKKAKENCPFGEYIVNDYFSKEAYYSITTQKAKVVTCIAMFYDLLDPHPFLCDVYDILADDGLFVVQMSYSPLMLKQLEIGNIAAEHVHYYTYMGLENLFNQHGLFIQDVELNDVNGGSFRVYCTKDARVFKNQQERDVAFIRKTSLLEWEYSRREENEYRDFYSDINELKIKLNEFIDKERLEGKTFACAAASTKGNTVLQHFRLDKNKITKISDRNPSKWGLKTIGTEIPICSEQELRDDHPDYIILLAWHFRDEFLDREKEYLNKGGKVILPMPKLEII